MYMESGICGYTVLCGVSLHFFDYLTIISLMVHVKFPMHLLREIG